MIIYNHIIEDFSVRALLLSHSGNLSQRITLYPTDCFFFQITSLTFHRKMPQFLLCIKNINSFTTKFLPFGIDIIADKLNNFFSIILCPREHETFELNSEFDFNDSKIT